MRERKSLGWMPQLFDNVATCLTHDNWYQAGVRTLACSLRALLCKPGLDFLYQLPKLADYVRWQGPLVLHADVTMSSAGVYAWQSPLDGKRMTLHPEALLALITQLQPDYVLLPLDIEQSVASTVWDNWPASVFPLFSAQSVDRMDFLPVKGWYTQVTTLNDLDHLPLCIRRDPKQSMVCGTLTWTQIQALTGLGLMGICSNQPMVDAQAGVFYTDTDCMDVTDKTMVFDFEPLDKNCTCETCEQSFTKAYLHHLLANTPLLAERFLCIHNAKKINSLF